MLQTLKKLYIYFETRVVNGILGWIFFMVYNIDKHKLNLKLFGYLKFLDKISFEKCVFFSFLNNKCIIISSF
jgi:hypothetical protein